MLCNFFSDFFIFFHLLSSKLIQYDSRNKTSEESQEQKQG